MEDRFKQQLTQLIEEPWAVHFLIAVSGGVDSVVLCHLCKKLNLSFTIAHCNFHLRGEDSNTDEQFVRALGASLGVSVLVQEFNTVDYAEEHKVSIQIAARALRYNWFSSLVANGEGSKLLTGHHLDDAMETFLINFSRGTGLEGLLGIPAHNDYICRPMLCFTREEIEQFAKKQGITWREDYTNQETKYLRNKIRKDIVPVFKSLNPGFAMSFQQMIGHLKDSFALSEIAVKAAYEAIARVAVDGVYFNIEAIKNLQVPEAFLYRWFNAYGFKAWEDIYQLLEGQSGKRVEGKGYFLIKDKEDLVLKASEAASLKKNKEQKYYIEQDQVLTKPIKIKVANYGATAELTATKHVIFVDGDTIKFPLEVRKPTVDDRFFPFGMKGSKTVKKFLKDEKLNMYQKENTWLLCSNQNIVWVIGNRMDERFKVRDTTKNIIKIEFIA